MIYLSGVVRPEFLGREDAGLMLTPYMGNRPDLSRTWWAADSGCFAHQADFSLGKYLTWLRSMERWRSTCLFVTAPDVPFDGEASLSASLGALGKVQAAGFPVALVTQDGMENMEIPLSRFDAVFVGGTTAWKTGEASLGLVARAHERGLWCHMGRVNSESRLLLARIGGCDSADGTYVAYGGEKNARRVLGWLGRQAERPIIRLLARGEA